MKGQSYGVVGMCASNWTSFLVEGGGGWLMRRGLFFLSFLAVSLSVLDVRLTEN